MTDDAAKAPAEGIRAMVFGATGYTGRHVVAALRTRGVQTAAHVRPGRSGRDEWVARFGSLGAETDGAAWDAESIADSLRTRDINLAFALLGTTRARAKRDGAGYDTVDVGMSLMIVEGLAQLSGTRRIVYLSSLGVGPSARGAYLRARHAVETAIRASNLEFVIARPATISGPDRDGRPLERFAARAGDGVLGALAAFGVRTPEQKWSSMTGEDLGHALVEFGLRDASANTIVTAADLRGWTDTTRRSRA